MQKLWKAFRRSNRNGVCGAPPAIKNLDIMPVFHGVKSFERTNRPRVGPEQRRRLPDDNATARRRQG